MTRFWPVLAADEMRTRIAYESGDRAVSYAELDARVNAVAVGLRQRGVTASRPLAVLVTNGPSFIEILHAALRLGAVLMPLHERLTTSELTLRLADAPDALLVHDLAHLRTAQALPVPRVDVAELPIADAPRIVGPESLDAPLAILHTSGSTGRPRAVPLTVRNFLTSAQASAAVLGLHAEDRWLACLTPAHVGGLSIYLRVALAGGTVVIHDGFEPSHVDRALDDGRATMISLVAATLERLLDERADRPFPPTARCALIGGGPVPADLVARSAACRLPLAISYGLTEAASQVATCSPGDTNPGCPPLPGTEVRVNEQGELLVRSATVSMACVDEEGWLHTGDAGHIDGAGRVYVDGRLDDLIITGGENVQPAEIERLLTAHEAVAEAAVAGVPDGAMGQAVIAWVRLRPDASCEAEDLRAHVRSTLAGFKVPRRVHLVNDLPRTPLGKIDRRSLREPH